MADITPSDTALEGQLPLRIAQSALCQTAPHIEQFLAEISSMIDQVNRLPVLSISDVVSMGCHADRPSDR